MDEKMRQELDRIQSITLSMQAEIMALTNFVMVRAPDPKATLEEIRQQTRTNHAKLLLLLENKDPELAARLDKRLQQDVE